MPSKSMSTAVALAMLAAYSTAAHAKIDINLPSASPENAEHVSRALARFEAATQMRAALPDLVEKLTLDGESLGVSEEDLEALKVASNKDSTNITGGPVGIACYTNCYSNCHGSRGWR
jgi:hypothetical protein